MAIVEIVAVERMTREEQLSQNPELIAAAFAVARFGSLEILAVAKNEATLSDFDRDLVCLQKIRSVLSDLRILAMAPDRQLRRPLSQQLL